MDKTTASGTVYCDTGEVVTVSRNFGSLSRQSNKEYKQFCENNITLANNWLGVSGDHFMFAANTIAAYLRETLKFYDANRDLLSNFALVFSDIDGELKESASGAIKEG